MRIDEAVRKAIKERKFIRQAGCMCARIKVEYGIPGTIMMIAGSNQVKGWNPTADELIADDWIVVD